MPKTRTRIPPALTSLVLYKSAKTCCVCRTPRKSVQIHHADENPSNNAEDNLIPLCQDCHDEAHTKHSLSQNLTPDRQLDFKLKWESEISRQSSIAMLPDSMSNALQQAMWTFVNHQKLPDLIQNYNISLDSEVFRYLKIRKLVDSNAIPIFQKQTNSDGLTTIYDHFEWDDSRRLHHLYTELIDKIILASKPIEIGAIWTKREIRLIIKPGMPCFCIRGFRFKPFKRVNGEEDRQVYACAKGIELRMLANTRHMYGSSALCDSFSGNRTAAVFFIAKEVLDENGKLVITGTPIAMGAGFILDEYKTPYSLRYGWAKGA